MKADHLQVVPENCQTVCQKHFHSKTGNKIKQSFFQFFRSAGSVQFKLPFSIAHDRAGDHLRKQAEIKRYIFELRLAENFFFIYVCLKGDHFKNVKTDPQRKQCFRYKYSQTLKKKKCARIQKNCHGQITFSFLLLPFLNAVALLLLPGCACKSII